MVFDFRIRLCLNSVSNNFGETGLRRHHDLSHWSAVTKTKSCMQNMYYKRITIFGINFRDSWIYCNEHVII